MLDPLCHLDLFREYDGPVIDLPDVTMITVDDRSDRDTTKRLERITRWHRRFLRPKREVIFSGARPSVDGIDWQRVEFSSHPRDYNQWCLREAYRCFSTRFVLIWQLDGFVLNPKQWRPSFLEYDYIGSPFFFIPGAVGNGGFSLRSKRLCKMASSLPDQGESAEDAFVCVAHRKRLVKRGLRFAPIELASKWGIESIDPNADLSGVFGFHGKPLLKSALAMLNQNIELRSSKLPVKDRRSCERAQSDPRRTILTNDIYGGTPPVIHCPGRRSAHNAGSWNLFCAISPVSPPCTLTSSATDVITWSSDEKISYLEEQCVRIGIQLTVLGRGITDWKMRMKYDLLREFAKSSRREVIIALDADDTVIQGDPVKCVNELYRTKCKALFGAERSSYPFSSADLKASEFELGKYKKPWVHLNSGLMVAYRSFVVDLPDAERDEDIDQATWRRLQMEMWPDIRVDHRCRVFQNINVARDDPKRETGVSVLPA